MDALLAEQNLAGQRVHEELRGARLKIFGREIPCCTTGIRNDFDLLAGKSRKTMVHSITFRAAEIGNGVPDKGVKCQLRVAETAAWVKLQLWEGGLTSNGQVYEFMAVDEFYNV